jgi:hypothetical protein
LRAMQFVRLDNGQLVPLPLQSFGELLNNTELRSDEISRLSRDVTLFPVSLFNPDTSPISVLEAKFGEESASLLEELRQRRGLDSEDVLRITGQELSETLTFWPGPAFRVDARVEKFGLVAHRETTVMIMPHELEPIIMAGQRRLQGEDLVQEIAP